jgi:hypothetical protein
VHTRESVRLWAAVAAIGAAGVLAAGLHFLSSAVNRPPVVTHLAAEPAAVSRQGSSTLRVSASDPDGDALQFAFAAQSGRLIVDPRRPAEARYEPAASGSSQDHVTVTVTDARGLSTSSTVAVAVEGEVAPPAPTEKPAAEVAVIASSEPSPTAAPPAAAHPVATPPLVTRPPAPTTAAAAAAHPNNPPVLDPGYRVDGLGDRSITLSASGSDPDGDPITFEWDTQGCFVITHRTQTEADVKLVPDCKEGTVRLIWTDSHGASTDTEWPITR